LLEYSPFELDGSEAAEGEPREELPESDPSVFCQHLVVGRMQTFEIIANNYELTGQLLHRLLEWDGLSLSCGDDGTLQRAVRFFLVETGHHAVGGSFFDDPFFILHNLFGVHDFIKEQEEVESLGCRIYLGDNCEVRSLAGQLGWLARGRSWWGLITRCRLLCRGLVFVHNPPLPILADPGRSIQDIPNRLLEILLCPYGSSGLDRGLAS
jgi:hypothetical protein